MKIQQKIEARKETSSDSFMEAMLNTHRTIRYIATLKATISGARLAELDGHRNVDGIRESRASLDGSRRGYGI